MASRRPGMDKDIRMDLLVIDRFREAIDRKISLTRCEMPLYCFVYLEIQFEAIHRYSR
jgi:hypothetical protein